MLIPVYSNSAMQCGGLPVVCCKEALTGLDIEVTCAEWQFRGPYSDTFHYSSTSHIRYNNIKP
jgi:hypothetical protein